MARSRTGYLSFRETKSHSRFKEYAGSGQQSGYWHRRPAREKATIHQGYYHQVWIDGNPLGAYGSYNEAKAAISADAQQSGRPLSKYAVVHKPADPAVVFMSRPMLADNEVALYENGQRIRLQLNDELLARAARNLGVDGASGLPRPHRVSIVG